MSPRRSEEEKLLEQLAPYRAAGGGGDLPWADLMSWVLYGLLGFLAVTLCIWLVSFFRSIEPNAALPVSEIEALKNEQAQQDLNELGAQIKEQEQAIEQNPALDRLRSTLSETEGSINQLLNSAKPKLEKGRKRVERMISGSSSDEIERF